jgi:probable HAF family extracellular repeat protein
MKSVMRAMMVALFLVFNNNRRKTMKSKVPIRVAIALVIALALTVRMMAQDVKVPQVMHRQYQFIDVGTLGGPNSSLPGSFFEGIATESLSRAGTFGGQADTATPDPFAPNCFGDCFVSHAIQWRDGVLTDLGALHRPESLSSASSWISGNGLIAGISQNGEIDPLNPGVPEVRAVLWKHGKITDLGNLEGGHETAAFALNNRGQVVGVATNTIPDPYSIVGFTTQTRAFLWQNGAMQDLGTLPGGTDAVALLVNERGQIVGESYTADSIPPPTPSCSDFPLTLHGFLWENDQMMDLGTLGGSCAFTYALNNRGQVVGQATLTGDQTSHPYMWDRKTKRMMDLGTLGGTYGFASWINDPGAVVGSATDQGDQALLAFLWKHGVISNLGTLPGNACSAADAINTTGQIVGGSGFNDAQFFPACTDLVEHAFLWENGTMVDLNAFVPPGSDLTLNEAVFINDRGEISGLGMLSNGDQHAFLLIPCDENHPDVQGCSYSLMDAAAATRESPGPVMHGPTNTAPRALRPFGRRGLTFNPGQIGARNAAIAGAIATLSPTSLTFSAQALGTTSPAKRVTVKNTGNTSLTITAIAITGTNAGDFAQTHTCGSSLAPGASCGISVTFTPTASGTRMAALSVTDNAAGSPQLVPLSGIGTTARLSPTSLSFGTVAISTASPAKTVTLTNVGTTTLTITAIAITGTNADDFAQTHTCGSSLAAGASCTVSVTFSPTQIGKRTGTLSVTDNAPGSPQKVTLNGIGTTAKLSPTSLNFGSVAVGTTSTAKTVTLTNVGTTTLSITGIAITGTNAGDFAQTHTCGSSLAAGGSCTVSVTFTPSATGSLSGTLSVTDDAPGSPQIVSLSGTGVAGRCQSKGENCYLGHPCCAGLTCVATNLRHICEAI